MHPDRVNTIKLNHELTLDIYDASRKIAADRWLVVLLAKIDIPVEEKYLEGEVDQIKEIKEILGESICYQKRLERNFIDQIRKKQIFNELHESLVQNTLPYLNKKNFAGQYIRKEFAEALKKRKYSAMS